MLLPLGAFSQTSQFELVAEGYGEPNREMPRSVYRGQGDYSHDPEGRFGTAMPGSVFGGARGYDPRKQAEQDAFSRRDEARQNPPLKLNIPVPERPKPGAVN
ncbi:hypothetical protein [Paraburkholderia fungorum]|uniref:hypothetical protein n=1 Tax=Paraburkholderia fungorum TaxID=134537 RepID=UPI0038BD4113